MEDHSRSGASGHVPTITQEDLANYHALHFPSTKSPAQLSDTYNQYMTQDDDGLGYYEDGNKRTLTDEQIAIFRHSEIQALLRERRLRREAEADDEHESTASSVRANKENGSQKSEENSPSRSASGHRLSGEKQSEDLNEMGKNKRQKMLNFQANQERWLEERTNRRMARELDEIREEHIELDY